MARMRRYLALVLGLAALVLPSTAAASVKLTFKEARRAALVDAHRLCPGFPINLLDQKRVSRTTIRIFLWVSMYYRVRFPGCSTSSIPPPSPPIRSASHRWTATVTKLGTNRYRVVDRLSDTVSL